jgi:type I restriction enzyme S subunit
MKPWENGRKKISSCLSSLDELIETYSQKLELLKDHKKGLMQYLFPHEGEKVPKHRFKHFENYEEWKYINGDKLFDSISNKNHNSDLPILSITQEYGAIPREKINYTVIATENSIENYKVVEKGDFIISLRSFQGGIEYSNYQGICSPAYVILRKKVMLDDMFFKYYFKSDLYIRHLNINIEGIRDGKMVSYKQFSEILLPFPSIEEQKKIAACLNSLDEINKGAIGNDRAIQTA